MTKIKLDIWEDPEGLTGLFFADELGEESRTLLEPGAKIIHSFYAGSHFEAMTVYYTFMGWGTYTSDFIEDKEPYILKELQDRQKIRCKIDIILWEDWDPLGVNDIAPRDEYISYVPQILNLTMNGNSIEELAERLYSLETKTMGMTGDLDHCKKIAKKIFHLKNEC